MHNSHSHIVALLPVQPIIFRTGKKKLTQIQDDKGRIMKANLLLLIAPKRGRN